jgi:hypothetical protein
MTMTVPPATDPAALQVAPVPLHPILETDAAKRSRARAALASALAGLRYEAAFNDACGAYLTPSIAVLATHLGFMLAQVQAHTLAELDHARG